MDGPCIGGTVGFDDRLCRAQEGGSAVFVGVHALFEVGHAALQQQVGQRALDAALEQALQLCAEELGQALG